MSEEQRLRQHFYNEISEDQKAEFINGEVVVQSPARYRHTNAVKYLLELLDFFVRKHNLGHVGSGKVLVSLSRNDYEPDICFFDKLKSNYFTPEQIKFPAPDFVVEVLSPSTEERDRTIKFEDYAAHGVREYWLVDPEKEIVEQYILEEEEYQLQLKSDSGMIKSAVIEGFEIPIRAIFDKTKNLETVKNILSE